MQYQTCLALLFLYLTIPVAEANTDYSTLEALCIAILVIFIIWVIVIIILICVCKKYIDKASTVSSDDDCSRGEMNVALVQDGRQSSQSKRKSSARVAPEEQRRSEMKNQLCQTDPNYLEPLGPNVGVQTSED